MQMRSGTREYLNKSWNRRRKEYLSAKSGNKEAFDKFVKYTNDLKVDVNSRMRDLKRAGFDYGKRLNDIRNWEESQGSRRLLSVNELGRDIDMMYIQSELAYNFINDPNTLVINAKHTLQRRFEAFQDKFAKELGEEGLGITPRKFRNFLRWLGDETTSKALEAYGTSDIIVDIAIDIYKKEGKSGLNIVNKLMLEWLTNINSGYNFEEQMERRFKIDFDYYRERKQKL